MSFVVGLPPANNKGDPQLWKGVEGFDIQHKGKERGVERKTTARGGKENETTVRTRESVETKMKEYECEVE